MDGQCKLGDAIGPCLPNLNNKWDLKHYGASYGASFAFGLIAVILSIVMMPLLQFLQWKPQAARRTLRITLFWVMFGIAVTTFVCLLVAYSIQLGHPRQVLQATGNNANYCDRYTVNGKYSSGTLCSWLGHRGVGSPNNPAYLPFTGLYVKNFYEYWNPRVAWQLLQVALGISLWNIIVIVGWRPNMST